MGLENRIGKQGVTVYGKPEGSKKCTALLFVWRYCCNSFDTTKLCDFVLGFFFLHFYLSALDRFLTSNIKSKSLTTSLRIDRNECWDIHYVPHIRVQTATSVCTVKCVVSTFWSLSGSTHWSFENNCSSYFFLLKSNTGFLQ